MLSQVASTQLVGLSHVGTEKGSLSITLVAYFGFPFCFIHRQYRKRAPNIRKLMMRGWSNCTGPVRSSDKNSPVDYDKLRGIAKLPILTGPSYSENNGGLRQVRIHTVSLSQVSAAGREQSEEQS